MGGKTFGPIGVLGLYTESPLHCGAESAAGYVDLPIQRERHTNFPVIPGTTIKGVFRDEIDDDVLFGKADAPGKISFGDGIIVAFPIRSSEAPFHWVTCPFVLERVFRALGQQPPDDTPDEGQALAASGGAVLLEELRLARQARPELFGEQGKLRKLLDFIPTSPGFEYTRKVFLERLLVVRDHDFEDFVTNCTEVVTRIKLTALGTTTNIAKGEHPEIEGEDRKGNMFVEELVPSETLFIAPLRAASGAELPDNNVPKLVRLGGDETVGRGITHVTLVRKGN